ncbi:hypothetical protein [Henriciella litoralis]|uniref:hypothetical protein n=1 Tax=Henriciella litoralis TaxID=568102 RepID=UPI000A03D488|nr:hypothetical protein [Henriciella litoralis]
MSICFRAIAACLAALVAIALPAEACRCVVYKSVSHAREAIARADLVFTGTAISIEDANRQNEDGELLGVTRFEVVEMHKGEAATTLDIYHRYDQGWVRCGPYFHAGETFLVMARQQGGSFMADHCSDMRVSTLSPHMIEALELPGPALCDTSEFQMEPDYRYHEEDFTAEAAEARLTDMRTMIPEWIESSSSEGRKIGFDTSELGMAYFNRLNVIQGYILRQKALAEQAGGESSEDTEAFCEFLRTTPIID